MGARTGHAWAEKRIVPRPQGALGQVITTLFTRTALAAHETNLKQLATAQTLGQYIRDMDLKPAQALQLETPEQANPPGPATV